MFRPTTAANNINDLIFAELVSKFDGIPGIEVVEQRRTNLRFLKFDNPRSPICLWLKKTDRGHHSSCYPTAHALRMESGQSSLFPDATILTLGHYPKFDLSAIQRVSITPPCGRRSAKPTWYINIAEGPARISAGVSPAGRQHSGLIITRSSHQRKLG